MRKVLILLLILPLICICNAQSNQLNELHFNHLTIKSGLPEDFITATLQDKEGYIWIGTQAGLVRYDGYTTKVYKFGLDDPNRYTITCIYEDRKGELWIGTLYEVLYHYDRAGDSFSHYTHNYKDDIGADNGGITSIHDDRNGNLWMIMSDIETKGKYINLFDTKKHQFKQFGILEKGNQYISASVITNSFEDNKGRTWIGTNNGIYEYTPASDKFIPHLASADSSQQKRFHHLTEDAAHPGIIWMTVMDVKSGKREGLLQYNTADNTVKAYRHVVKNSTSLGNDAVYTIQIDSKGHLWFGTADGLSVFEVSSERFINYSLKDKKTGPDGNIIKEIKEDKAGDFWSYDQNGLLFFDTKTKA